jgi:hypothetical protein
MVLLDYARVFVSHLHDGAVMDNVAAQADAPPLFDLGSHAYPRRIPTHQLAPFRRSCIISVCLVAWYNFIGSRAVRQYCKPCTSAPLNGRKPNSGKIILAAQVLLRCSR